jgi:predicted AAA+ superfamily ATPase
MAIREHILRTVAAANNWMGGMPYAEWLRRFIPENYIDRAKTIFPSDNRACMVTGPRQAGKSTLIWHTVSGLNQRAVLLNCEEPAIREWLISPSVFLSELAEAAPNPEIIFLEEAQRLKDAAIFIKGIVDLKSGLKIFVTGGSSFHLDAKTRESLAGRADRHLLLPFSLQELVRSDYMKEKSAAIKVRELLEEMLVYGGYPSVVFSGEPQAELVRLTEAFIIRDASDRFRISNTAAFRKLLSLAASQIGNLVNFSEWGAICGISNDTAANYVALLEESHIVRMVRPFVGGKRAEITGAPKVFFLDNGIRNTMFGGFRAFPDRVDTGVLVENLVFTELAKRVNPLLDGLYFWRNKGGAEVDFVLERRGLLTGVEVKAGDCRGRISRSSRSFIEAYSPHDFIVVNSGKYPGMKVASTDVRFLQPEDLAGGIWREKPGT